MTSLEELESFFDKEIEFFMTNVPLNVKIIEGKNIALEKAIENY